MHLSKRNDVSNILIIVLLSAKHFKKIHIYKACCLPICNMAKNLTFCMTKSHGLYTRNVFLYTRKFSLYTKVLKKCPCPKVRTEGQNIRNINVFL